MSLLELTNELNISPKRTASTKGGEYHSSCPACGGKDRFIIWEQIGRYFCRQCQKKGDAIQFCRDFMGMDYLSACSKLKIEAKTSFTNKILDKPTFTPLPAELPSLTWRSKAKQFAQACSEALLNDKTATQKLMVERDLSTQSIQQFCMGWNAFDQFLPLSEWDLSSPPSVQGQEKKLWLPRGIVIPAFHGNELAKLKVRRSSWRQGDKLPKYIEVSGSIKSPSLYGQEKVILILEAELDAILVQQVASDLCCCMAMGGATKRPDIYSHQLLKSSPLILFALDFDEAGKKAYQFWRSTYVQLRAWPIPKGKSPGDAIKLGVDIRQWIVHGRQQFNMEIKQ